MRALRFLLKLTIALLVLAGCRQARPSARSLPPLGGSRLIAYVSNQRLFVMGTDRSDPIQLTEEGWYVEDFLWSPDGTRIAFMAYVCDPDPDTCTQALYSVQPDGGGPMRITPDPGSSGRSCLSRGRLMGRRSRIARTSPAISPRRRHHDIRLLTADGSGRAAPAFPVWRGGAGAADHLAWSPDGTQIAFEAAIEDMEDSKIYLLDVRTSELTRLTDEAGLDWGPAWSPDGSRIAFLTDRAGETGLFLIHRDGSDLAQLALSADSETLPQWSPDGAQIAYTADDDIYLANVNGSEPVRLTDTPEREWNPVWSPDGQWIMVAGGDHNIYARAVYEPAVITLADELAQEVFALWQP
jgi:dipeptidyl aminopeptidase/acylaminoacyl peptidase